MPSSPSPAPFDPVGPPLQASRRPRGTILHLFLLAASFYTMTLCGAFAQAGRLDLDASAPLTGLLLDWRFLQLGLSYSLCLLAILGAHEMGHYLTCRYYGVDASLPYFLPSLPFPIGTFGAFIRIRDPIPNRRVLFDVGVSGPLAGFCVAVPVLIYGVATAQPVPMPSSGTIAIGDPLLVTLLSAWLSPAVPEGYTMIWCGPLMAGWVGCLATALNLFPIGQLDGGHICYAVSARFHRVASWGGLAGFFAMGLLLFPGWLFMTALLVIFTPRHPPLLDESPGLSRGRLLLAVVALVILILCVIPRPFVLDAS